MSYTSQGYSSQNANPTSGKPGGGGYGGEDPPQSGKRRHQQQQTSPVRGPSSSGFHQKDNYPGSYYSSLPGYQSSLLNQPGEQQPQGKDPPESGKSRHQTQQRQQASPATVLPQGNLPENNNPDEQQPPGVPINPKDNDLSNHQTPNQSYKQVTSIHDLSPQAANNHGRKHLPVSTEANSKADQEGNSHGLKDQHTNGYEEKPHCQPMQQPESLPVPDGYPKPKPPTSPSKLEPRPKKGLLEKICCCCCSR